MKKVNLFLLCLCAVIGNAQNVEGTWQLNSAKLANYQSAYDFTENNTFAYGAGMYNGLSRNRGIRGKYEIKQDSIYFTVLYMSESVGGTIKRRAITTNKMTEMELYWESAQPPHLSGYRPIPSTSNYWEFTDYKIQNITFENPETWAASFKYYRDESGQEIIEIDGDKYYYIPGEEDFGEEVEE